MQEANVQWTFEGSAPGKFITKLFSHLHLEQWEREIKQINKKESKLICSIWGSSASEVSYLASKVCRIGADAIELSLFSPIGMRNRMIVDQAEKITEFIEAICNSVDIPVIVKLSYEIGTDPSVTKQIYDSGIRIVSAIDGLKGLSDVDIETQSVKMPTYGGFTGDSIRPMALATTAALKQNTSLQICSVGGISNYAHVLGYLMLGADAVQLASAIQLHGFQVITKIKEDLSKWLDAHHYRSFEDIKGCALSSLIPFEDIKPQPLIAAISDRECVPGCERCVTSCLYGAIFHHDMELEVQPSLCIGCGMCVDICPCQKISLVWQ